jgi:hypothetical protein
MCVEAAPEIGITQRAEQSNAHVHEQISWPGTGRESDASSSGQCPGRDSGSKKDDRRGKRSVCAASADPVSSRTNGPGGRGIRRFSACARRCGPRRTCPGHDRICPAPAVAMQRPRPVLQPRSSIRVVGRVRAQAAGLDVGLVLHYLRLRTARILDHSGPVPPLKALRRSGCLTPTNHHWRVERLARTPWRTLAAPSVKTRRSNFRTLRCVSRQQSSFSPSRRSRAAAAAAGAPPAVHEDSGRPRWREVRAFSRSSCAR